MIRWHTIRVRTGLIVAAMAATAPVITSAQPKEPAMERAAETTGQVNANPTSGENSTDKGPSVQTGPRSTPATPPVADTETPINKLRREILDDRAAYIDRWLGVVAIVLTFFGIVVAIVGIWGFRRFRDIETEAKNSAKIAAKHSSDAERLVEQIKEHRDRSEEMIRAMYAKIAADEPEQAARPAETIQEDPQSLQVDKAVAHAVSLQREGKKDEAINKWRTIALTAEESNPDLAVRAWFSVGYLLGETREAISAYDHLIRLKPDYVAAYYNRGLAKAELGRHQEAIADYDEAIRLKPDYVAAYYNRGNSKAKLGRHQEAIADYDEAIRLKLDYAKAYGNRGLAKAKLGRHQEAIADYDEAIRLKPDYAEAYNNRGLAKFILGRNDTAPMDLKTALNLARKVGNSDLEAHVEQLLRVLDGKTGS